MNAKELAKKFHDIYEELAPEFGYKTRKDTKEFSEHTSNGQLMIATCKKLLDELPHERIVKPIFTEDRLNELKLLRSLVETTKSLDNGNNFITNVKYAIMLAETLGYLDYTTPRDSFVEFLEKLAIESKN